MALYGLNAWQYQNSDLALLLQFCLKILKMYEWLLQLQKQKSYKVFDFSKNWIFEFCDFKKFS